MRIGKRGFSLVDLVAVAAVVSLVASVGVPSLFRASELSRRMVCSVNLKGIGTASKIYAASNDDRWMIPGFKASAIENGGINYLALAQVSQIPPAQGEVGFLRAEESESEDSNGAGGSSAVTVTRSFWMLVRSGAASPHLFVCPSASSDTVDPTVNTNLFFDFESYNNISYGLQVPFGPIATQPREGADARRVHAADKGPFYFQALVNWNVGPNGKPVTVDDPPSFWRTLNSPNHGGAGNGEGQNVLFSDGSVSFERIPAVAADNDNIYTVMADDWTLAQGVNRIHGDSPHTSPEQNPYPGQEAIHPGPNGFSSTDTLLYP